MKQIPILTYHKIDRKFEVGITRIKPEKFEKQIKFLVESGFKFLTLSEARSVSDGNYIALSFDDAYDGVFKYAYPILKNYGIRATVFVITGYIGGENSWDVSFGIKFKHMGWSELEKLKASGWEIGSHTVKHLDLTRLNYDEVKYELFESKNTLEKTLGVKVSSVAVPFGRLNDTVVKLASEAGYEAVYVLTKNFNSANVYTRFAVYSIDSNRSILRKLKGSKFEVLKLNLINSFSLVTSALKSK